MSFKTTDRVRVFPQLNGQTLDGRTITLPDDAAGRVTLVLMGFEAHTDDFAAWAHPFYYKFSDFPDEVAFYEVALVESPYRSVASFVERPLRERVPSSLHDRVVPFYGSLGPYCEALEMHDRQQCYAFLLDQQGRIRFVAVGAATPERLAQLYEAVLQLL